MTASLPARNGVGASSLWLPPGPWCTVLDFLAERFPAVGAAAWAARMRRGDVRAADGVALAPDSAYRGGVRLYYYRELMSEAPIPFAETVLYRDDRLLVADKPHFLPVAPTGQYLQETLLVRLKRKLNLDFLVPIHRLDRETAGVVLFSIEPASRGAYHALFERRRVTKIYEALAPELPGTGFPVTRRARLAAGEPFFRVTEVAGVPNSETLIEQVESRGGVARYRLTPVTGRKHQLRVHMAALGAPILNDTFYPELRPAEAGDFAAPLQLLAKSLAFSDPITGEPRYFETRFVLSGK